MSPRAPKAKVSPAPEERSTAHVPLVRVYIAVSLDGFIADATGGVGWLDRFFSPEIDFSAFARTIGATVWGRRTFDQVMGWGRAGGNSGRTVVLTRRPLPTNAPRGVEAFAGDVRELVSRLRAELAGSGKDIWLGGGGASIQPFREADLVDRWELSIIPVLLGDGVPLFPRSAVGARTLKLSAQRVLSNGIVHTQYERG